MAFEFPEDLAPELYPLAWLVGTWRGPGFVAYPGVEQQPIVVESSFSHDGGPYLSYQSTMWLLKGEFNSLEDEVDVATLEAGAVWATEQGYWRIPPAASTEVAPTSDTEPARTELELLLAEPTGHVSVFLGAAQGARIQLASDLIARTQSAAEVTAGQRIYGLVNSELYWAHDLAAFGQELQSYASGRMQRW